VEVDLKMEVKSENPWESYGLSAITLWTFNVTTDAQKDVINCLTGRAMNESRNQLAEAARIARGKVKALTELNPAQYDAIILPEVLGQQKTYVTLLAKDATGKLLPIFKKNFSLFIQALNLLEPFALHLSLSPSPFEKKLSLKRWRRRRNGSSHRKTWPQTRCDFC
jgi:enhancing lycopene biosynthesis protein 2